MTLFHKLTLEDGRERVPLLRFGGDDRERPADDAAAEAFDSLPGALHDPRRWGTLG
jgi:methylaspartate ammonia-lyase